MLRCEQRDMQAILLIFTELVRMVIYLWGAEKLNIKLSIFSQIFGLT